jgi:hypothetical protein
LFFFTAKLFLVSEQPFSSTGCHKESFLQAKKYLRDDQILPELLLDNLSDVRDNILSDNESDMTRILQLKEKLCGRKKITVTVKQAPRKVTVLQMRGQPRE